ncbi:MAG: metallophosphoesterase, partial [Flavobacteriaceae bacterium]
MKNRFYFYFIQILCFIVFGSCKSEHKTINEPVKIAFLADVHLQDIHANFTDANYKGIKNPATGKYNTIRTMGSQLRSTRLFNENYFAFKEALDEIVSRNITIVVLPGDFSDDGQPINIKALKKMLDDYAINHGIQFFLTTGNHDPIRPYSSEAGKTNFLGERGMEQIILSDSSLINRNHTSQPIISSEIKEWGYLEILNELSS